MRTTRRLPTMLPIRVAFFLFALTRADAFTVSPVQRQLRFAAMRWPISCSSSSSSSSEKTESSTKRTSSSSFPESIDSSQQQQQQQQQQPLTYRGVRRIEKFTRLPVWPVWSGVLIWMVQKVLGDAAAARFEDAWAGRVCPNFFHYEETSPFVMLVHHCHSFAVWDPVRWIQRSFFPEGFPAHPHRGFITVTYILEGGFVHRDSTGVRQEYGGSVQRTMSSQQQQQPHTQWLNTGSGMLHEEMFDNRSRRQDWLKPVRQELYQVWLNVPATEKWSEPSTCLLGHNRTTPLVMQESNGNSGVKTLVLAGNFQGQYAEAPAVSDVAILHVQIPAQQQWVYQVPTQYETLLLYVRKGNGLECVTASSTMPTRGDGIGSSGRTDIPVHHVAYMEATGDALVLHNTHDKDLVDILVLAGEPLREPFFASGSMVMSSPNEINQAYADYQRGLFGVPWDHKLTDQEWVQHIEKTKPPGMEMKVTSGSSLDKRT